MKNLKKISSILILFFCIAQGLYAQQSALTFKKDFIFSAIKGTASKPDSTVFNATIKIVAFSAGDSVAFKIKLQENGKFIAVFKPASDFIGIAKAVVKAVNKSGKLIATITLTGLSTKGLEGENEAPLSVIINALGYKINVGWPGLANNCLPQLQGEEIAAATFKKATTGKVAMIPVARYSPDFKLPFGYYINNTTMPLQKEVGVLSTAAIYPEHQCLFPAIASGTNSFDPGANAFGFYATGPTHNAYSEDVWNMLLYPANAVHATRVFALKDKKGNVIANSYLLCFEEAKNGDYNDYVFIVNNVIPIIKEPFVNLFNEKNLNGWHTFLNDKGINTDPDNNFRVEDNVLHVIGKDLGYAITENGYSNYHFKVDFKWGERKWGSRVNLVRDAGICYNIPTNEPDSIWPQSIECQIQEGDVGDFWLLGFSTITVNGITSKPANHTRMIKQKDAERPYGEWNTVEIISYNGKCVHIVNGVVVNVGENASVTSGRILLQSEYAEIYYKNIKLRQL